MDSTLVTACYWSCPEPSQNFFQSQGKLTWITEYEGQHNLLEVDVGRPSSPAHVTCIVFVLIASELRTLRRYHHTHSQSIPPKSAGSSPLWLVIKYRDAIHAIQHLIWPVQVAVDA